MQVVNVENIIDKWLYAAVFAYIPLVLSEIRLFICVKKDVLYAAILLILSENTVPV